MPLNTTPSVWGDLGLAGQNQQQLKDQQDMARKKKILAAAGTDLQSATQTFYGSRSLGSMTPAV